jgi:anti-sigma factor RsiW
MPTQDHRHYEEDLAASLLGALDPSEAREFQAHLDTCARCQAEERWLRAAIEILSSSVEQIEPPPALRKRLMQTVNAEAASEARGEPKRSSLRRWRTALLRPASALATVAVLAAGLAGYLLRGEGGTKTTTVPMQATAAEPSARATIVRSKDGALLRVGRLPVQRGKQLQPSSLFVVRKDGSGGAAIPGGLEGVQAVMVSEEPEGGSTKPTTKPVLAAKL